MLKTLNGKTVRVEKKISNLDLLMTTKKGYHLWLSEENQFITDNKQGIISSLNADLLSGNVNDVFHAIAVADAIAYIGGWDEVIEDKN